jgi:selenide, water dikinase
LCGLDFPSDANVLVGLGRADDAGVYRVSDELALIQTVDFFTPVVDDPYWFGQIAAANALSDVYAMGGVPKTALNLVAFPGKSMDLGVLRQIIQGGIDKLREAGVALIGGHSVEDKEIKYGLAVTGYVHPAQIRTKTGLRHGDRLVLTKPLGTGIVNTAIKAGLANGATVEQVTRIMAALNRTAAEVMSEFRVHACTDITGFGFVGHLAEMVAGTDIGAQIDASRVPLLPAALEFAAMGLIPAGAYKNRSFREDMVQIAPGVDRAVADVLHDPQTSGGLLIGVESSDAGPLVQALRARGIDAAEVIGEASNHPPGRIIIAQGEL